MTNARYEGCFRNGRDGIRVIVTVGKTPLGCLEAQVLHKKDEGAFYTSDRLSEIPETELGARTLAHLLSEGRWREAILPLNGEGRGKLFKRVADYVRSQYSPTY